MNKKDIVKKIADGAMISQVSAQQFIELFLDTISSALEAGEKVTLVGFGTFSISQRSARTMRNPQTGKNVEVPARKLVKFKAGKKIAEIVN